MLGVHARDDDGTRLPDVRITIFRTTRGELFPLLPFVFFAQESDVIEDRAQTMFDAALTGEFREASLPNSTLDIYRHLLNIVGSRLRAHPTATITLTGCNNANDGERNNTALSRRRAEAVKDYLVRTWGIAPARIAVQARNLPKEAPDRTTLEGREEARRVEISSTSPEILRPVQWRAEEQRVQAPTVVLAPRVESEAGVALWNATLEQRGVRLASYEGSGTVPAELAWRIDSSNVPAIDVPITARLAVRDRAAQTREADTVFVVRQSTDTEELFEKEGGRRIDRFSLILFDFNKSNIGPENARILDIVRQAIKANSRVTIYGYADRTGNPELNRALAQARCESVQRALGISGARIEAVGSDRLLFDNDLAEGRNYCRTVQIVVETGISE